MLKINISMIIPIIFPFHFHQYILILFFHYYDHNFLEFGYKYPVYNS